MSSLLVVVQSHLFPQFVQLYALAGVTGEMASLRLSVASGRELHGAAAVGSIAMDDMRLATGTTQ